ncbi:MAG: DUF370 domain-containing protein [Oscillospiraceae bacterium]|jgi:regulator of extracellular matrix RemA (YlzA/DUF370 family)|nr:DUF370 domain-containing protein [Oscillospiraceae bacterium]MCI9550694.1 DUF370 domain-containing protein [Oscillospiraceae bacterium]
MKLVNIGFGNMVSAQRVVAIVSPDSAPVKRLGQEARERGVLIDASFGRKTRAVLVTDSGHVIWSSLSPEQVSARFQEAPETEEETP